MIQDILSSDVIQTNSSGIKLSVIQFQSCYKNSFQIFKYFWIDVHRNSFLVQEIMLLILHRLELKTTAVLFSLLLLITNKKLS